MTRYVETIILDTLNKLNGHATVKQLSLASGYTEEYLRPNCDLLLREGILQSTSSNPRIWSKSGDTLITRTQFTVDRFVMKKLIRIARDDDNAEGLRRDWSGNPTLEKLLEAADLAGYIIVAIPKLAN